MLEINKKLDAKILDAGLADKDGKPQPYVKFEITDSQAGKHQLTWYGNLKSEKSTEFAVKTLVGMGFKGNDFADLSAGVMSFDSAVELTVELEHPSKDNVPDTTKFRIKFVNAKSKGPAQFKGTVPSQVALFSRIKSELGVKKAKPATTPNTDW